MIYFRAASVLPCGVNLGSKSLENSLRAVELILALALIVLILMQSRGTSLGSVFGQEGSVFHTRRGAERILFNVSIGVAVAFLCVGLGLAHVAG
jgi:preprotein translocase subunit SecG